MGDNTKVKKYIIIMIIICLVLLLMLIYLLNKRRTENNVYNNNQVSDNTNGDYNELKEAYPDLYTDTSVKQVEYTEYVLEIQNCINKYYEYNYSKNNTAIYNILDKDYIKQKNITEENIFSNITNVNRNTKVIVKKIYQKEITFDREYKYYVYCQTYDVANYNKIDELMFIVNCDLIDNVFCIVPEEKMSLEEFTNYMQTIIESDDGKKQVVSDSSTSTNLVEKNEYNKFTRLKGSELTNEIIQNYYKYYYFLQVNDGDNAYNLLDENYKKIRFNTKEDYINYIRNNKSNRLNLKYIKQSVMNNKNYYIGITDENKYFIIIENKPLDFSVMLDSYTVPLTETTTKYNSATSEQKACMCLEQVKEMLNNKDYKTIYNHLNSTYKNNNFETQAKFESYMKEKFYDINNFKYESYQVSNNSYIINVKVSDNTDETKNFTMNFVVKLADSIDKFEMSFEK